MQSSMPEPVQSDWREAAACRDEDPGLFFSPEREKPSARGARLKQAYEVCERCDVAVAVKCLADALSHKERYGVRGGTDLGDEEREQRLKTQRARRRAGAAS